MNPISALLAALAVLTAVFVGGWTRAVMAVKGERGAPTHFGSEVTMPDCIALWHAEHVNFATHLDLLEGQLDLFHTGASPDYELMLDIMYYMAHYPDVAARA